MVPACNVSTCRKIKQEDLPELYDKTLSQNKGTILFRKSNIIFAGRETAVCKRCPILLRMAHLGVSYSSHGRLRRGRPQTQKPEPKPFQWAGSPLKLPWKKQLVTDGN